jgi:hypothetical protein
MSIFVSVLGVSANPYREGSLLVVPAGSSLPPNCVKCGAPTPDKLARAFRWHSSWLYLLIFAGLIFYAIVALVVQKKVKLEVPFCSAHRAWRTRMNITGAVLLIASVPASFLFAALDVNGGWVALIGVVLAFSGLVVLALVGSSFTAVYIDDNYATFKGASEQFLAALSSSSVSTPTAI